MSYAVVSTWSVDDRYDRSTELDGRLQREIMPLVAGLPGFESGVWTVNLDRTATDGIIVFDTEENANALLGFISADPQRDDGNGVVLTSAHTALVVGIV